MRKTSGRRQLAAEGVSFASACFWLETRSVHSRRDHPYHFNVTAELDSCGARVTSANSWCFLRIYIYIYMILIFVSLKSNSNWRFLWVQSVTGKNFQMCKQYQCQSGRPVSRWKYLKTIAWISMKVCTVTNGHQMIYSNLDCDGLSSCVTSRSEFYLAVNISTSNQQIAAKLCTDMHGSLTMFPNNFTHRLAFALVLY